MQVYLDTNIVIYFVEQPANWGLRAANRVADYRALLASLVTSDLARMECRVGPLISKDPAKIARMDAFFVAPFLRVFSLTTQVCDRAAPIRAAYRFSAVDSLHLAAAVEGGCDVFLTNDLRLSKFPDLTVEAL